jgi:hypothetical protein
MGTRTLTASDIGADNYNGWDLLTDGTSRGRITSGEDVNFVGGSNVSLEYSSTNNTITINSTDTNTDTNTFLNSLSFNTGNGVLTATLNNGNTVTEDLDGRYLTSESDTLQSVTDRGNTTTNNIGISGKISLNDGGNSVFVGEGAGLNDDASDNRNVGVGYDALQNNTTGGVNTAIGYEALRDNTAGQYNTATGYNALRDNTEGNDNTANGTGALEHNTTGNFNTAIGEFAGSTTGNLNPNQTGNNSLFLGNETKVNADGQTNQIVIGYNATGLGSNTVVLGNSDIETTALRGNVGIGTTSPNQPLTVQGNDPNGISIFASNDIVAFSDESVKENIRPIENVVQRITQSRGVLYDRKDSKNKDNIGFIAQELEQQFPELVTTNKDGTKSVKYQNATAVLFEAVKQQQQQLDKHEAQIQELKKLITDGSTK